MVKHLITVGNHSHKVPALPRGRALIFHTVVQCTNLHISKFSNWCSVLSKGL